MEVSQHVLPNVTFRVVLEMMAVVGRRSESFKIVTRDATLTSAGVALELLQGCSTAVDKNIAACTAFLILLYLA